MISHADVRRLLGNLDDGRVAAIVELKPAQAEVELAATCLDGRMYMLTRSGRHLSATAARIMKIVLSDQETLRRERRDCCDDRGPPPSFGPRHLE